VPREGGLSQKFKLSISGSITSSAMISQFCTLGRGRTAKPNPNKGLAYRILRRKVVSALIPNYYLAFEPSQSDQWSCMKTTHDSIQDLPIQKAQQANAEPLTHNHHHGRRSLKYNARRAAPLLSL
jgi:hypothetical protein